MVKENDVLIQEGVGKFRVATIYDLRRPAFVRVLNIGEERVEVVDEWGTVFSIPIGRIM